MKLVKVKKIDESGFNHLRQCRDFLSKSKESLRNAIDEIGKSKSITIDEYDQLSDSISGIKTMLETIERNRQFFKREIDKKAG